MKRIVKSLLLAFVLIYLAPLAASALIWTGSDQPDHWRAANWSSAGLLSTPNPDDAEIRLFAARTGRWKGIFAVHSWIVLKRPGAIQYERYEVVGWGRPIRKNAYAPDARWYSNEPVQLALLSGEEARQALPLIDEAIAAYPHGERGHYRLWPGPNSNTFVAHIVDQIPALRSALPPTAVGKNFPVTGASISYQANALHVSLGGYVSFRFDLNNGFELGLFGLNAGLDWAYPAIKLPGIGRIGWPSTA